MKENNFKVGKYQHYKNKIIYEVLGLAFHSETNEEMIIYKAVYQENNPDNKIWARPKKMFFENVFYNGEKVQRFKWVGE